MLMEITTLSLFIKKEELFNGPSQKKKKKKEILNV